MQTTKQRHFTLMEGLETRYRKYGAPAEAERALLQRLLQDHDEHVTRFKTSMQQLRERDPAAHNTLVALIAEVNTALAPFERTEH